MELNDNKYRITIFFSFEIRIQSGLKGMCHVVSLCHMMMSHVTHFFESWDDDLGYRWQSGISRVSSEWFCQISALFCQYDTLYHLKARRKRLYSISRDQTHVINLNQSLTIFEISFKSFNQSTFRGNRLIKRSPEDRRHIEKIVFSHVTPAYKIRNLNPFSLVSSLAVHTVRRNLQ